MKTLYLLRHAKSDWSAPEGNDHMRPLNKRGRAAAGSIGRFLTNIDQVPDLVLSSSALRAVTTAELAAEAGGWSCPVQSTDGLYSTSTSAALSLITQQDAGAERLLTVGHEPTWSDLASWLIGGGRLQLPTAALVRIDFDADRWSRVEAGQGALVWMLTPKLLARAG